MHYKMHFLIVLMCILFMHVLITGALPCDSCGNECASACGTKHFRTCCFNYLRKRTDPDAQKFITNKRLIDFILLQGRALFTQNELSRGNDDRHWKNRLIQRNGTLLDTGPPSYAYFG